MQSKQSLITYIVDDTSVKGIPVFEENIVYWDFKTKKWLNHIYTKEWSDGLKIYKPLLEDTIYWDKLSLLIIVRMESYQGGTNQNLTRLNYFKTKRKTRNKILLIEPIHTHLELLNILHKK